MIRNGLKSRGVESNAHNKWNQCEGNVLRENQGTRKNVIGHFEIHTIIVVRFK